MLGKLSSVGILVERLKKAGCANWAVTEFVHPGGKTRRWGVAWSWLGLRPRGGVARGVKGRALKGSVSAAAATKDVEPEHDEALEGGLLPFPAEFEFEIQDPMGVEEVGKRVNAEINGLELQWQWKPAGGVGLGVAEKGDCWSRKARRRMEQESRMKVVEDEEMRDDDEEEEEDKEPELVFKIQVRRSQISEKGGDEGKAKAKEKGGVVAVAVMVRWLQGHDHVLFESFCGWLKRKLDLDRR